METSDEIYYWQQKFGEIFGTQVATFLRYMQYLYKVVASVRTKLANVEEI